MELCGEGRRRRYVAFLQLPFPSPDVLSAMSFLFFSTFSLTPAFHLLRDLAILIVFFTSFFSRLCDVRLFFSLFFLATFWLSPSHHYDVTCYFWVCSVCVSPPTSPYMSLTAVISTPNNPFYCLHTYLVPLCVSFLAFHVCVFSLFP